MRSLAAGLITALSLGIATNAAAGQRDVTLRVEGMTCASCPYMVRQALLDVEGVRAADVSYDRERASVAYDDAKADIEDLTRATGAIGFPSEPIEEPTDG